MGVNNEAAILTKALIEGRPGEDSPDLDFDRLANLIAIGDAEFPDELPACQIMKLAQSVSKIRYRILLNFVARAIAKAMVSAS